MYADIRLTFKLDTNGTKAEAELAEAIDYYLQKRYLPHEVAICKQAKDTEFIVQVDLQSDSLTSIDLEKAYINGIVYAFQWMVLFQIQERNDKEESQKADPIDITEPGQNTCENCGISIPDKGPSGRKLKFCLTPECIKDRTRKYAAAAYQRNCIARQRCKGKIVLDQEHPSVPKEKPNGKSSIEERIDLLSRICGCGKPYITDGRWTSCPICRGDYSAEKLGMELEKIQEVFEAA